MWQRPTAALILFAASTASFVWEATGACSSYGTCSTCIGSGEEWTEPRPGVCLWYESPFNLGFGVCLAGNPGIQELQPATGRPDLDGYGVWTTSIATAGGQVTEAGFVLYDIDQGSDGGCYETSVCVNGETCAPGYTIISNEPCYPDLAGTEYSRWRSLRCCRLQRNMDGNLRGFETDMDGAIEGKVFFAACCTPCPPGFTNPGCSAYHTGECLMCPNGRYKDVSGAEGECQACPACPEGTVRRGCGPSSVGRCEECESGRFKIAGEEGQVEDECDECPRDCHMGSLRVGCGGSSPGYCESCPQGRWFASPNCVDCAACEMGAIPKTRVGCGGAQDGTCSRCTAGRYEYATSVCTDCQECAAVLGPEEVGGLAIASPTAQRIGCGGAAPGLCVRMAAALDQEPPVPVPQGSSLRVRLAMSGLAAQQLRSGHGNCSAAHGLCLAAVWHAELLLRSASATNGLVVGKLSDWWPDELTTQSFSGGNASAFYAVRQLPPLPLNLPKGAGYFIRVELQDRGGSCCSMSSFGGAPVAAVTEDFTIGDPEAGTEAAWQAAAVQAATGNREGAIELLENACAGREGAAGAQNLLVWLTCERAKACRLGMALGDQTTISTPLVTSAATPYVAAGLAMYTVAQVRQDLGRWEAIEAQALARVLPNATAWRLLVDAGEPTQSSTIVMSNGTSFEITSPFADLLQSAYDVEAAAISAESLWRREVTVTEQQLQGTLDDLKEADRLLDDSAAAIGFSVVRASQAVAYNLERGLIDGPPAGADPAIWFNNGLQTISSTALLLLGTWRATWVHGLGWSINVEVGAEDSAWPPHLGHGAFGGAPMALDAVPMERTSTRVWQQFHDAANAWLDYATAPERRLATEEEGAAASQGRRATAAVRRRLSRATGSLANVSLSEVSFVREVLAYVETVTEQVIEPLSRAGARLLAGPLPNITSCGVDARCLSAGLSASFESATIQVAVLGFGQGVVRPWLDPHDEDVRIQRAAVEIVSVAQTRIELLEALLLELLDTRDTRLEAEVAHAAANDAGNAAEHLRMLATAPAGQETPGAPWHFYDIHDSLTRSLRLCRISLDLLGFRRMVQLNKLVTWFEPGWTNPTSFAQGASAVELQLAETSAGVRLEALLGNIADQSTRAGTGLLRVDISESNRPIAMASLIRSGDMILDLRLTPGLSGLRMHEDAVAFAISPDGPFSALQPITDSGVGGTLSIGSTTLPAHVWVEMRRLRSGTSGNPQLEGRMRFATRHERRRCNQFVPPASGSLDGLVGPFVPVDGLWIVRMRDGNSGQVLNIDFGTSFRLLLKVDVPQSAPPWEFIAGSRDILYRLPESARCEDLQGIGALIPPTSTTTFNSLRQNTGSGSTTTSTFPLLNTGGTNGGGVAQQLPEQPRITLVPHLQTESNKDESFPLWIAALGFGLSIMTLCACASGIFWFWRRRLRKNAKVADNNKEDKEKLAGPSSETLADALGLRRLAEDTATLPEPPSAAALLPSALSPPGPIAGAAAPAAEDTGHGEEWDNDNVATPPGRTPEGSSDSESSSGSSSGSGSGTSESDDESPETHRRPPAQEDGTHVPDDSAREANTGPSAPEQPEPETAGNAAITTKGGGKNRTSSRTPRMGSSENASTHAGSDTARTSRTSLGERSSSLRPAAVPTDSIAAPDPVAPSTPEAAGQNKTAGQNETASASPLWMLKEFSPVKAAEPRQQKTVEEAEGGGAPPPPPPPRSHPPAPTGEAPVPLAPPPPPSSQPSAPNVDAPEPLVPPPPLRDAMAAIDEELPPPPSEQLRPPPPPSDDAVPLLPLAPATPQPPAPRSDAPLPPAEAPPSALIDQWALPPGPEGLSSSDSESGSGFESD